MPDDLDDFLGTDSSTDSGQSGKGLRAQLEAALAREKALNERFEQLAKNERQRSLGDLFAKHSIPDLAKDFFPADADLTDETATGFVEKYGQLWGATAQQATTPPDQQAATSAMQQFASQASPAQVIPQTEDAYRAKFAETKSADELMKLISEYEATAFGMGD